MAVLRSGMYLLTLFCSAALFAEPQTESVTEEKPPEARIYGKTVKADFSKTYKKVFNLLENNSYFVIFEPNIGSNLSHFKQRWGENYNRNKIEAIRSMVFCNGWYANEIGNIDPSMLALCPLHITLTHKKGKTTVLFVRPSQVALNSPAFKVALELEQDVIRVIEEALD